MKSLLIIVVGSAMLVGCATPAQNAILGGAVAGAVVSTIITSPPPPPPRHVHRPLQCQTVLSGYDVYHRPIYQQVCR